MQNFSTASIEAAGVAGAGKELEMVGLWGWKQPEKGGLEGGAFPYYLPIWVPPLVRGAVWLDWVSTGMGCMTNMLGEGWVKKLRGVGWIDNDRVGELQDMGGLKKIAGVWKNCRVLVGLKFVGWVKKLLDVVWTEICGVGEEMQGESKTAMWMKIAEWVVHNGWKVHASAEIG